MLRSSRSQAQLYPCLLNGKSKKVGNWALYLFDFARNFNAGIYGDIFFYSGDHIVPNFEEIWPSKKGKAERPKRGLEYYYDAMMNGPQLSGKKSPKTIY